jgi:hypothetical protein
MTPPLLRRLFATLVASIFIAAACSGTGGPASPSGSASITFPPVATASALPSEAVWPDDWPGVICDATTSLAEAVDDITKGIAAADDNDPTGAADAATDASTIVTRVADALDGVTPWERGRGVSVNLRSAATHLGNAARQLTNWTDKATDARLKAAKTYLNSAKTNLGRAATNQTTLQKSTGFTC